MTIISMNDALSEGRNLACLLDFQYATIFDAQI